MRKKHNEDKPFYLTFTKTAIFGWVCDSDVAIVIGLF